MKPEPGWPALDCAAFRGAPEGFFVPDEFGVPPKPRGLWQRILARLAGLLCAAIAALASLAIVLAIAAILLM